MDRSGEGYKSLASCDNTVTKSRELLGQGRDYTLQFTKQQASINVYIATCSTDVRHPHQL